MNSEFQDEVVLKHVPRAGPEQLRIMDELAKQWEPKAADRDGNSAAKLIDRTLMSSYTRWMRNSFPMCMATDALLSFAKAAATHAGIFLADAKGEIDPELWDSMSGKSCSTRNG